MTFVEIQKLDCLVSNVELVKPTEPFEEAVKATFPGKLVIMSSYNCAGSVWSGFARSSRKRCSAVSEHSEAWSFPTTSATTATSDRAIRGGTDIILGTTSNDAILTDTTSDTFLQAMRQATKDVFYTTVNSAAFENYVPGIIPAWQSTSYIIEGMVAALAILGEVVIVRDYLKKNKAASKR